MCDYCRGYDGLDAAEGGPDEILISAGIRVKPVSRLPWSCKRMAGCVR